MQEQKPESKLSFTVPEGVSLRSAVTTLRAMADLLDRSAAASGAPDTEWVLDESVTVSVSMEGRSEATNDAVIGVYMKAAQCLKGEQQEVPPDVSSAVAAFARRLPKDGAQIGIETPLGTITLDSIDIGNRTESLRANEILEFDVVEGKLNKVNESGRIRCRVQDEFGTEVAFQVESEREAEIWDLGGDFIHLEGWMTSDPKTGEPKACRVVHDIRAFRETTEPLPVKRIPARRRPVTIRAEVAVRELLSEYSF